MVPLGFSDHTHGPLASSLAVALGACVLEKHFTLDRNLPGPDHWFAENPDSLKIWIENMKKSKNQGFSGNEVSKIVLIGDGGVGKTTFLNTRTSDRSV